MKTQRLIAAAALAAGLAVAAPASADTFSCSASAVRGTILGQTGIEPVVANGGEEGCRTDTVRAGLPAPLGGLAVATTSLAGPADEPAAQQAVAGAGITNLAVGSLRDLPIALPAAQLPAGLDAIPVALPTTIGPLSLPSGLPSLIHVDALDAAKALVPARSLPDLPLAAIDSLRSFVGAQCVAGLPDLTGASTLEGLRGLGESLPTDAPVDRVVTLLGAQTIPLSGISPDQVKLPAGLSLSDPLTGSILRDAIAQVLSTLPPIEVPATVAGVQTTPAEQIASEHGLEQHALRMKVTMLGQQVADLVLGIARVATDGLSCGPKAAAKGADAPAQDAPAAPVAPASQLAVQCTKQKVTLINVLDNGRHVRLEGAADKRFVGRKVRIVFTATGKRVATTHVRRSGFFSARAPMPSRSIRYTSRARYMAIVAGEKSMPLKLHRRMRFSVLRHHGRHVTLTGRIFGPRTSRPVEIRQRVSCTKDVVVGHARADRNGVWRITLKAPKRARAAVYRATTMVRPETGGSKRFPTFTLPGYVSL